MGNLPLFRSAASMAHGGCTAQEARLTISWQARNPFSTARPVGPSVFHSAAPAFVRLRTGCGGRRHGQEKDETSNPEASGRRPKQTPRRRGPSRVAPTGGVARWGRPGPPPTSPLETSRQAALSSRGLRLVKPLRPPDRDAADRFCPDLVQSLVGSVEAQAALGSVPARRGARLDGPRPADPWLGRRPGGSRRAGARHVLASALAGSAARTCRDPGPWGGRRDRGIGGLGPTREPR